MYLIRKNIQKHKKRDKTTLLDCKVHFLFPQFNDAKKTLLASSCSNSSPGRFLCGYLLKKYRECHCVKSVQIRSFFWSAFSRTRTEYGEIRSISPYSVQMRENVDQKKLGIWTLFTQYVSVLFSVKA